MPLPIPGRWPTKPPAGWGINREHAIGRHISSLWMLNEGNAGRVLGDLAGRSPAAVAGGDIAVSATRYGSARLFTTAGPYATVASYTRGSSVRFSFVALVRCNLLGGSFQEVIRHQLGTPAFLVLNSSNSWAFTVHGTSPEYDSTATPATANAYASLVGTYDGANVKLYLNGVLGQNVASASAIGTGAAALDIGNSAANQLFSGDIVYAMICNSACLTAGDAAMLAEESFCFMDGPLEHYWVMPSASGGGPFPFYTRRNMAGGMIPMSGGVC